MPAASLLPQKTPFGEAERTRLDEILSPASALQRSWLAGFLSTLDGDAAAIPAERQPRASEPVAILFASESGNAERLAMRAARLVRNGGLKPVLLDMAELDVSGLRGMKHLLAIVSTWGEGQPPFRATRAYAELMGKSAPTLDGTAYCVLALGDRAYTRFCEVGRAIDRRLAELGATRVLERVDCDLDFEGMASAWMTTALDALIPNRSKAAQNVVCVDFGNSGLQGAIPEIVSAEVTYKTVLSSSRSDKEVVHLEFACEGIAYQPGDCIEIFPRNDWALVDEILQRTGLSADKVLRKNLFSGRDVTTLSRPAAERYADIARSSDLHAILSRPVKPAWTETRQLVDLLDTFPTPLTAEELLSLTRPLAPRAYSIASSRKEVGDQAHLLIAAVRYRAHGRDRSGVASVYAADRVTHGTTVHVRLRPNRHFRLPGPDTDIVMVGAGTGVAPFRSFVQERRADGAHGRNWLFYGDRRFTHDFLYQLEWQEALADGSLTRLDPAFSRDTPEKVHVQHLMWKRRRDLVDWLDGGAHFYVCGDARAMAAGVRATLVNIFSDVKDLPPDAAEAAVAELAHARRYLQDVY